MSTATDTGELLVSHEREIDVACVGSWTNFDHLFQVDRLPAVGDTVRITTDIRSIEQVYWGGCAPNNAVAVARLGARAALVSVVGRDFRERGYAAYLAQQGVDQRGVVVLEDALSGHSFLFSDPSGNAICLSQVGAASRQSSFQPSERVLAHCRVAVLNYAFDAFALQAARIASASGAVVITSGALSTAPTCAEAIMRETNILVCTEHELNQLCLQLALPGPSGLFDTGISAVVATRGPQGSFVMMPAETVKVPAALAACVVDPVGAGDGFVGGLATGLALGHELTTAVRLGAVVASFVVEKVGCQTNLPSYSQAAARIWEAYGINI